MAAERPLTIGLVAGESSGDNLGAALIEAIAARAPGTRFVGVAGPRMEAAGCERLADAHELAVMGLFEVLHHLPRLLSLRSRVRAAMRALRPDVFVGTVAEKMLIYALGRGLEPIDMPVVRGIVRDAAARNYAMQSILLGIVQSRPFQMRTKLGNTSAESGVTSPGRAEAKAKADISTRAAN